ncbi:MarR family winged helix-turn-helix transcriptional regulator [Mameliella alba]|uniref:MarR family winged helix-turn-helix transcriptional regulator n=1 Tax=Mameliella alba TaxID=561184 RepID=UPI0008815E5D|nr:MarR family transcriptional regulator [Mameliella alba]MBY6117792.1 MarR family transcriptional regulator [Mameliella alba]OWV44431.1 MarR family transcriptional regulator [Mameliella alba]OWV48811.1 MarR family transcriptional regulator [Mameliella alba]OWV65159.1 MarR family transcriptional regulator [Mameliella alba]PTR39389.1 DNA-binding MarR family transcriptional regulator [Mameliella alba]
MDDMKHDPSNDSSGDAIEAYVLDEQIGYALRKANQRHMTIFGEKMLDGLTPTQFSALFRLVESPGPQSQNALGRSVAMDAATIKGVVNRLEARGLVMSRKDEVDRRRYVIEATAKGRELIKAAMPVMAEITEATMAPLTIAERRTILRLLAKLS